MAGWWGVEVHRRCIGETSFVCPRCGVDRTGTEVRPQRWFAVCHLRLVPLATMDRVIECETCLGAFDVGVLEVPTTDELRGYLELAHRSAAATLVRSIQTTTRLQGSEMIDPAVIQGTVSVMASEGVRYDAAMLEHDLAAFDDDTTQRALHQLARELSNHGKQGFLHRMTAIATTNGPLGPLERRVLVTIGAALGMSAPHINGVLAGVERRADVA